MRKDHFSTGRSQLVLMCQIIMVLVFALAAAACVRVFAFTYERSTYNADRDKAVVLVESAAEICKLSGGQLDTVCANMGGSIEEGTLVIRYDSDWQTASKNPRYTLTVLPSDSGQNLMGTADIFVRNAGGEELFAITVAWQGGAEDE